MRRESCYGSHWFSFRGYTVSKITASALTVRRRWQRRSRSIQGFPHSSATRTPRWPLFVLTISLRSLSYNHIRDDGAAALAEALKVNTGLSELECDHRPAAVAVIGIHPEVAQSILQSH